MRRARVRRTTHGSNRSPRLSGATIARLRIPPRGWLPPRGRRLRELRAAAGEVPPACHGLQGSYRTRTPGALAWLMMADAMTVPVGHGVRSYTSSERISFRHQNVERRDIARGEMPADHTRTCALHVCVRAALNLRRLDAHEYPSAESVMRPFRLPLRARIRPRSIVPTRIPRKSSFPPSARQ